MGFLNVAAIALHVEQPEWRGGFVHIPQHLPEEGFVLLLAHAQSGLRNKVAEGKRRRKLVGLSQQMCLNL